MEYNHVILSDVDALQKIYRKLETIKAEFPTRFTGSRSHCCVASTIGVLVTVSPASTAPGWFAPGGGAVVHSDRRGRRFAPRAL